MIILSNLLYKKMNIPSSCYAGNTIFKKYFYENATMNKQDKEIFKDHINKITWQYSLKPDTINIQPYKDEEKEYEEIAIIEVQLDNDSKFKKIAELIQRTIPYPVVLVFNYQEQYLINVAFKKINNSHDNRNVIEESVFTKWIDLDNRTGMVEDFLNIIDIHNFSFSNFYRFYTDLVGKIYLFNASVYEECILRNTTMPPTEIKQITDEIEKTEADILEIKRKIKKEAHFNVRIELNIKIKNLQARKQELIQTLKR